MTKSIQLKLRGSRYVDTRNKLRATELTVEEVCTEDFINAKAPAPTRPGSSLGSVTARPGSSLATRGAIGGGRGAPMLARGRGMPPLGGAGAGRGRGMPAMGRGAPMPGMPLSARGPVMLPLKTESEEPIME